MSYIDKITDKDSGESRIISPAADAVRVDNENYEGSDLDDVLDEIAEAIDDAGSGGYAPPPGGIPNTDLAPAVQTSLGKADTAYQKPASGIPASDIAAGVIPDVSGLVTKTEVNEGLAGKVDKETGKSLMSNAERATLGKILNINTNDENRGTPYRIWVGTQAELSALSEFEEDVIYLVGSTPSASHSVTKSGIGQHITVSGTDASTQQVDDGGTFTITLSVASGYTMDAVVVTMGGVNITSSAYNSSTGVINISNVTGDIVISATATKHIASIAVSAGTRSGYTIPLTASVSPADADNVSLAWSIDNTTDFSISGSGSSATLTIKSSAENASVTITCADTNASSGTATGTLQLTGQYYNNPVPITALGNVSYVAGQNANTYQFSVGVTPSNGNTPAIVWSVAASPANAASIDSSTGLLTITADCSVVVTATAGQLSSSSSSIALTHAEDPNAPIVWEDANMEAFMLSKVPHANPNYITYAEAASYSNPAFAADTSGASYQFGNIRNVVTKFNEWQYFTGLKGVNLTGFTALTEITMPSTVVLGAIYNKDYTQIADDTSDPSNILYLAISHLVIPEGVVSMTNLNVGKPPISGLSLREIEWPSTLETFIRPNTPNVKVLDLSKTKITTIGGLKGMSGVEIIKLPKTLTTIGTSASQTQLLRECTAGSKHYVEFGDSINGSDVTGVYINPYNGPSDINLIFHTSTPPEFSWGTGSAPAAIYVPDDAVATYQAATGFSSHSSKIKGLSELPSGWDTPSANS